MSGGGKMPRQEIEEGVFLSEAIDYDSFRLNKLNLVVAPCGAGKTTAAFEAIPQHLNVSPSRSLILIDTSAGAQSFVNDNYANYYDGITGKEWETIFHPLPENEQKPTVMTYAFFGALLKRKELDIHNYDYIVCDEIHSLNNYIAMSRGKLKKQYPQAATWEINDMLQMTCFSYMALEGIWHILKEGTIWVFGMTATPDNLYKNDLSKLEQFINEVQFSQKLHAYSILSKFEYSEIEPILRELVPENHKRLFYFNTIKELQEYKQILIECGRAAEALWSINSPQKMDEHQLTTRDCILSEHRFPDDVQDLLINSAYQTSINIKDELVQEVYAHTGNREQQIQARGRVRQNIEKFGMYSKGQFKDVKKTAREKTQEKNLAAQIPLCFYNIPLYAEEKEELLAAIHYPKKWPSLKKALNDLSVTVLDKNDGKRRYSIIVKKL